MSNFFSTILFDLIVLGQGTGGAYAAGQWFGRIFLVVLIGAIIWKLVKKD